MNFLRSLILLAIAATFAGCTDAGPLFKPPYRKIRVTDYEGLLISEWIAEGRVWAKGDGYNFKAVQRETSPPHPVVMKYPNGKNVHVGGPNIVVMPCNKPEWLREMDGW